MTPDVAPAAREMSRLLASIDDDQLNGRTPCEDYRLGDLVDHIVTLVDGFTAAAAKKPDPAPEGPTADASRLPADWRDGIDASLDLLVDAWSDPEAWEGRTHVGGLALDGREAGVVVLGELVVHGWDVARAVGETYRPDPPTLALVTQFVTAAAANPVPGLFAPPVSPPEDASELDRAVALSGRNPGWEPGDR